MVGSNRPQGRVTVESAWKLRRTKRNYGTSNKGPYRYWFFGDQSQTEIEVPNIKSISMNSSLDKDTAECTITVYNTTHNSAATQLNEQPGVLGNPGSLGFNYASNPEIRALYGQNQNSWANVLVPNALLRTYQGYGGYEADGVTPKPIPDAVQDGELAITGTWLIDTVTVGTNGMMTLKCRDMGKLLTDQTIYVPLIPARYYPLKYCRFLYEFVPGSPAVDPIPKVDTKPVPLRHFDSNAQRWYPHLTADSLYHGRKINAWVDGDLKTETWSVGTIHPSRIFSRVWWEASAGGANVNEVYIKSSYNSFGTTWISIREGGEWKGAQVIPWDDNNGDGRSDSLAGSQFAAKEDTDIPFVSRVSVTDKGAWYKLPRTFKAQRIRVTTIENWYSPIGPFHYRAVVREVRARHKDETIEGRPGVPEVPDSTLQKDGNILDWVDAVKDLLLWSGFLFYQGQNPPGGAEVHGLIETSGNYPAECLNEDFFDKKSPMEVITAIKEILGYIFFVDAEGGVRFHSPNWWSSGNTLDSGTRTSYVPELLDTQTIVDYTSQYDDRSMRSEVIVGSMVPEETDDRTKFSRHTPQNVSLLRGMVQPAILINEVYQNELEQKLMAALIALHMMFQARSGRVTILANPEIQINDQVRITERNSSESYLHYVRSISSEHNLDTGEWFMTLETNWLGEEDEWVFDREFFIRTYFPDSDVDALVSDFFDSGLAGQVLSQDAPRPRAFVPDPGGNGAASG
jgi:hypothetical protein